MPSACAISKLELEFVGRQTPACESAGSIRVVKSLFRKVAIFFGFHTVFHLRAAVTVRGLTLLQNIRAM